MRASLFQDFAPRATGGELVLRTGMRLNFDYDLTRYTSFSLPVVAHREDPVGGDRDVGYYVRTQPRLTYRITPRVRVATSYRFRYLDETDSAASHAVVLEFRYDFPTLLSSR